MGTDATCGKCPSCARGTYRENGHMTFGALMRALNDREETPGRSLPCSVPKDLRVLIHVIKIYPQR